jgi:hypothetical protein
MKKFKMSLAATATVLAIAGCGDNEEGNNGIGNDTNQNNEEAEEVNEEPDVNMADNNENNDEFDADNNEGLNDDNNAGLEDDGEEAEAVMDQDFQDFNLNVTLVDETEWEFTYNPAHEDGEEPQATVSGDDIDLEGEEAVEEMEAYLSEFHVNAASEQEEITSEIADTFDFNQDDFQEYNLTIDFAEQENETEWTWSQDEDEEAEGGEENEDENDADNNDDGLNFDDDNNNNE